MHLSLGDALTGVVFFSLSSFSPTTKPELHCIRPTDQIYARSRKSDWERAMAKKTRDFVEMPSF
jgi:hypothetical protein